MTNQVIATIVTLILTNWVEIGTFTPKEGIRQKVERPFYITNKECNITFEGKSYSFQLESIQGNRIKELEDRYTNISVSYMTNVSFLPFDKGQSVIFH